MARYVEHIHKHYIGCILVIKYIPQHLWLGDTRHKAWRRWSCSGIVHWLLRSFIDSLIPSISFCYLVMVLVADSWFKMSRCLILLAWLGGVISVESGCTPELLRSDEAGSYYRLIEEGMGTAKQLLWHWGRRCVVWNIQERNRIDKKNLFKERDLQIFTCFSFQKSLWPFRWFFDFSGWTMKRVVLAGRREDHLLKVDGILDLQLDWDW